MANNKFYFLSKLIAGLLAKMISNWKKRAKNQV